MQRLRTNMTLATSMGEPFLTGVVSYMSQQPSNHKPYGKLVFTWPPIVIATYPYPTNTGLHVVLIIYSVRNECDPTSGNWCKYHEHWTQLLSFSDRSLSNGIHLFSFHNKQATIKLCKIRFSLHALTLLSQILGWPTPVYATNFTLHQKMNATFQN